MDPQPGGARQAATGSPWRRRIETLRAAVRRSPLGAATWKVVVVLVGTVLVGSGIVMLVTPGPGWAAIILGLGVLSTEFQWAARWRTATAERVRRARRWLSGRPAWVRAGAFLGIAAGVAGLGYLTLVVVGVPDWLPGRVREPLRALPLLGG